MTKMSTKSVQLRYILWLVFFVNGVKSQQYGPDPWNYDLTESTIERNQNEVPPDLKIVPKSKLTREHAVSMNDWFYKRLLGILLKGGKVKKHDSGYMDITLQMHIPIDQWETLNDYLTSDNALSEDMFRRSVGYVQDAILKPTATETLVVAWKDYIQLYVAFMEQYKMHITWSLGGLAATLLSLFVWKNISHRHVYILIFAVLYLYEVFVSYKEAEQQEYNNFISSLNSCKWYFWSSACDIPRPDPMIFIKHMHPLKIGMRIFTMIVSEPLVVISSTINTMIHGVTDGLWFPFNKIMFGLLIAVVNSFLILFLLIILFNFILNIPFNLSFFAGLVNIGIKQRERNFTNVIQNNKDVDLGGGDRLSGANLDKLISVFSHAITSNSQNKQNKKFYSMLQKSKPNSLTKSASTGRLCDLMIEAKPALVPKSKNVNNNKWSRKNKGVEENS